MRVFHKFIIFFALLNILITLAATGYYFIPDIWLGRFIYVMGSCTAICVLMAVVLDWATRDET